MRDTVCPRVNLACHLSRHEGEIYGGTARRNATAGLEQGGLLQQSSPREIETLLLRRTAICKLYKVYSAGQRAISGRITRWTRNRINQWITGGAGSNLA